MRKNLSQLKTRLAWEKQALLDQRIALLARREFAVSCNNDEEVVRINEMLDAIQRRFAAVEALNRGRRIAWHLRRAIPRVKVDQRADLRSEMRTVSRRCAELRQSLCM
jgi:hypothetical protein